MTCIASQHGTDSAYRNHGCTCPAARRAHNIAAKRYKLKRNRVGAPLTTDPTGTRRRIQALARIGWPLEWIAARANTDRTTLRRITVNDHQVVRRTTSAAIARVYDELYAEDGPSVRTARRAARLQWNPPWSWTDDTIDDPVAWPQNPGPRRARRVEVDLVKVDNAVAGVRVGLTIAERRVVVARLHALGLNDRAIERHTGISDRTALRIRQELRLPVIGGNQLAGAA